MNVKQRAISITIDAHTILMHNIKANKFFKDKVDLIILKWKLFEGRETKKSTLNNQHSCHYVKIFDSSLKLINSDILSYLMNSEN